LGRGGFFGSYSAAVVCISLSGTVTGDSKVTRNKITLKSLEMRLGSPCALKSVNFDDRIPNIFKTNILVIQRELYGPICFSVIIFKITE